MNKLILLFVVSNFILGGLCDCNSTNVFQWSCYTTTQEQSIEQLAQQFNMPPSKLCDYNLVELKQCNTVPANFNLRIPNNTCQAKQGSFQCYTVQKGDTFDSIINGNNVLVRDLQLLLSYNEDLLWTKQGYAPQLFYNMTLRIPNPYCIPDYKNKLTCHTVVEQETLYNISIQYGISVDELMKINQQTLAGNTNINIGMRLQVPDRSALYPVPQKCEDSLYYGCYTVQSGDSLFNIAQSLKNDPYKMCELNSLKNCDFIMLGQVLTYQKNDCVDNEQYVCFTVPATKQNKSDNNPYVLGTVSQFSQNSPFLGFDQTYFNLLFSFNQHQLGYYSCHNNQTGRDCVVHAGMQIRLPFKYCVPNLNQTCYFVDEIKEKFYPGNLYQLGSNLYYDDYDRTITATYFYHRNMDLRIFRPLVPNTTFSGLTDCKDTPSIHICYKLQQGDYMQLVAQNFNIPTDVLCNYNNIYNCSFVAYDRAVQIPINYQGTDLLELSRGFLQQIKD